MATACIVLAFVCFALVLLFLVRRRRRIRLVVARYKEDVGWIREVMRAYPSLHVVLCLKGPALTTEEESLLPPAVSVERLPNVGRCDHTFLDHIVRYYDALADVTVFASGAASDPRKGPKIRKVLRMAAEGGDTVLLGQKTDDARRPRSISRLGSGCPQAPPIGLDRARTPAWSWLRCAPSTCGSTHSSPSCATCAFPSSAGCPSSQSTGATSGSTVSSGTPTFSDNSHRTRTRRWVTGQGAIRIASCDHVERSWGAIFWPYPAANVHSD